MFGEECTLPMDIGLPKEQLDTTDSITSPYAIWVRDALEEAYDQVRQHSGQAVQRQKRLYDRRAVKRSFAVGDWVMRYYSPAKKCKLDSPWIGPYLIVSFMGWTIGIHDGALPRRQEDTYSNGSGVLVDIKEIINSTIGYDTGSQHNA